jgi:vanillate/3-O-methylgallate O-demethylase
MAHLEDQIQASGSALALLRSGRSGACPFPIRAEFTN